MVVSIFNSLIQRTADWRYVFISYEKTILPFVRFNKIQRCLYMKNEEWKKNRDKVVTRLFVNTFLLGYCVLNRIDGKDKLIHYICMICGFIQVINMLRDR